MKIAIIGLSIIFSIMSISPAFAGGRHGHHYNKHHHKGRHHYSGHGHYDHYSYRPQRHYGHYESHGDYAAYALGGLVVGGILGATLTNSYNNSAGGAYYRKPIYASSRIVNNSVRPSYMMQPDGICYLVSHVDNGNLVLSPVVSENCR